MTLKESHVESGAFAGFGQTPLTHELLCGCKTTVHEWRAYEGVTLDMNRDASASPHDVASTCKNHGQPFNSDQRRRAPLDAVSAREPTK